MGHRIFQFFSENPSTPFLGAHTPVMHDIRIKDHETDPGGDDGVVHFPSRRRRRSPGAAATADGVWTVLAPREDNFSARPLKPLSANETLRIFERVVFRKSNLRYNLIRPMRQSGSLNARFLTFLAPVPLG